MENSEKSCINDEIYQEVVSFNREPLTLIIGVRVFGDCGKRCKLL